MEVMHLHNSSKTLKTKPLTFVMLIYYASFDHIGEKLIKLQLPIFNHFPIDFIP